MVGYDLDYMLALFSSTIVIDVLLYYWVLKYCYPCL